jgi:hypothetical protein
MEQGGAQVNNNCPGFGQAHVFMAEGEDRTYYSIVGADLVGHRCRSVEGLKITAGHRPALHLLSTH